MKSVDVWTKQVSEKKKIVFWFAVICIVLANTSVFLIGSRCASQPCQNGGVCFDFSAADGYLSQCPYPYKGLHCHLVEKSCSESECSGRVGKIAPTYKAYTNDMALDYICFCHDGSRWSVALSYAAKHCYIDELFVPKCEGEPPIGALPFTNKGFYICPRSTESLYIKSCALHHVRNETQKEFVLENN